jgi:hypothetical protein
MACDDAALRYGMAADEYATHLLGDHEILPATVGALAVVPMARESTFERRIVAMLNRSADRRPVTRGDLAAMTVLLLVLTAPASILHARQAGPLPFHRVNLRRVGRTATRGVGVAHRQPAARAEDGQRRLRPLRHPVGAGGESTCCASCGRALRHSVQDVELASAGDWARVVTLQVGEVQESVKVETERTSAKRAPEPAGASLKVGGNIRPPRKLTHVNPVYPQSMKDAGIEGVRTARGRDRRRRVGSDCARADLLEVHPDLAIAAGGRRCASGSLRRRCLTGKPVPVKMKVTIEFRLKD